MKKLLLRECPFCDSEADYLEFDSSAINCIKGCCLVEGKSKKAVTKKWNTRKAQTRVEKLLDAAIDDYNKELYNSNRMKQGLLKIKITVPHRIRAAHGFFTREVPNPIYEIASEALIGQTI